MRSCEAERERHPADVPVSIDGRYSKVGFRAPFCTVSALAPSGKVLASTNIGRVTNNQPTPTTAQSEICSSKALESKGTERLLPQLKTYAKRVCIDGDCAMKKVITENGFEACRDTNHARCGLVRRLAKIEKQRGATKIQGLKGLSVRIGDRVRNILYEKSFMSMRRQLCSPDSLKEISELPAPIAPYKKITLKMLPISFEEAGITHIPIDGGGLWPIPPSPPPTIPPLVAPWDEITLHVPEDNFPSIDDPKISWENVYAPLDPDPEFPESHPIPPEFLPINEEINDEIPDMFLFPSTEPPPEEPAEESDSEEWSEESSLDDSNPDDLPNLDLLFQTFRTKIYGILGHITDTDHSTCSHGEIRIDPKKVLSNPDIIQQVKKELDSFIEESPLFLSTLSSTNPSEAFHSRVGSMVDKKKHYKKSYGPRVHTSILKANLGNSYLETPAKIAPKKIHFSPPVKKRINSLDFEEARKKARKKSEMGMKRRSQLKRESKKFDEGLVKHALETYKPKKPCTPPISKAFLTCSYCGRSYVYPRALSNHIKKLHPEVK